jgi:hypothetical protein
VTSDHGYASEVGLPGAQEVLKVTRCLREVVAELSGDEHEGSEDDEVCAFAHAHVHWEMAIGMCSCGRLGLCFIGWPQHAESAHVALKSLQHVLYAQYMDLIGL